MTMDSHRDIAALADGSLEPARRDELLRRVDASPALAAALADQEAALAAIRATAGEPASDALRASVAALAARAPAPARRTRRRPRWALAGAGGLATLLAATVVLLAGGGSSGPSVAEAARLALAPPTVDGTGHPYGTDGAGWRTVGARRDVLRGRAVRTVFYADAGGRLIGYAVVAGAALPVHGGHDVERHGVRMRVLRAGDAAIVSWLRDGHTCILAARGVDAGVLLGLALQHAA
jgi:hypothetical protein